MTFLITKISKWTISPVAKIRSAGGKKKKERKRERKKKKAASGREEKYCRPTNELLLRQKTPCGLSRLTDSYQSWGVFEQRFPGFDDNMYVCVKRDIESIEHLLFPRNQCKIQHWIMAILHSVSVGCWQNKSTNQSLGVLSMFAMICSSHIFGIWCKRNLMLN